jgi:hypothetical protein
MIGDHHGGIGPIVGFRSATTTFEIMANVDDVSQIIKESADIGEILNFY